MALIDFYVRNQKLTKISPKLVSDSINYVNCSFAFKTPDWDGMEKWVVFSKGEENYRVNLVDDAIPKEAGLNLGAGLWRVSLFGENPQGTERITTNSVTVEVAKSTIQDGEPLTPIALTEAEQIAAKAQRALDAANEVKAKAENGEFNGKDGYTPLVEVYLFNDFEQKITGTEIKVTYEDGSYTISRVLDGKNATPEQIAKAVEDYLKENPIPGGGGSVEITAESIVEALGYVPIKPSEIPKVPSKVSELENDEGFLKDYTETDPTVPSWAKQSTKPKYTNSEVGLGNVANERQYSAQNPPPYPVAKVNNKTGDVQLGADDVGAEPAGAVAAHNTSTDAHNDIRIVLNAIKASLEAFLDINEPTLDQLSELIQKIEDNAGSIEQLTNGKVNISDIVNNLTTNASNKPLSAAQGVVLKGFIDGLEVVANNATTTAGTASTNASEAKTAATNASNKVDNLESRMDSGEFKGETGPEGPQGPVGPTGPAYVLTEADIAEIVEQVHESIGTPIFGVVDSNNGIVLTGALSDGTYSVKYEMENGSKINVGNLVIDTNVYYSVKNTLTNCTNSNSATQVVKGQSYSATITAKSGYELKSVSVTMGGSAVSVSNGVINIASVTGNIVITAVAEQKSVEPITQNIELTRDMSIVVGTGADRANTTSYVATPFIDVSNIPKPCTIHLTGARWAFASATETGYVRFYIANKSGTKLASDYTHSSKMPSGVTMVVNDTTNYLDVTVTVTNDNVGTLRFAGHMNYNSDAVGNETATLTYTPN